MAVTLEELKQIPALGDLHDGDLKLLSTLLVRKRYQPGEIIFFEGEQARGIWFILSGRVRIIKMSAHGRVQALCVANSGKCFGGCPLFDGDINPANAQAIDDVELVVLLRQEASTLEQTSPELMRILLQIFSRRLAMLARLSEGLGAWAVSTRINDCLLTYAVNYDSRLMVRLTHEKLATLAGTVREVVTRHLDRLEKRGVVTLEQGVIILNDIETLRATCLMNYEDSS